MSWSIREAGFDPSRIAASGNKFMTGNGYLGCRGTLDEFAKTELTAVTLAGLYDQVGNKWREPVNAPNGLSTALFWDGAPLSVLTRQPLEHTQELDIRHAVHRRMTKYGVPGGETVTVLSERFCSAARLNLIVSRISVTCSAGGELTIRTGIDGDVWDINGPHLERQETGEHGGSLAATGWTHELNVPVSVAETAEVADRVDSAFGIPAILHEGPSVYREYRLACRAGETYTLVKYVSVVTGLDSEGDTGEEAVRLSLTAREIGYDRLLEEHKERWEHKWSLSDVLIEGDEAAQQALRYSMYQLHIIAPGHSEHLSIPARGLSGQVYKGAVFWDTEIFMLPFFLHTQPEVARNLLMYRVHTLDGARRKAAEYGYAGAFYAWESQETGDDACTLFNVNDVFTGRPMRTYFRDKQVHISADVSYGIWQFHRFTGDTRLLLDGGAEVAWEVAKFFYSYAYFNPLKQRYEILDVTGPDEYHERVNNNAFTNRLVKEALRIALEALEVVKTHDPEKYEGLTAGAIRPEQIQDLFDRLYVPQPDVHTLLIEQFDRYFALEDIALAELKARMLNPHEYLGGGSGLATTAQILKQADVVLMLHLFKEDYPEAVKKANWAYYEPRTEHGSSLSSCIYALVAADTGSPDWGYPYFIKTATIDLTGDSKQYVGDLYIGGTHPAANGGAWMAAVLGFAGLHYGGGDTVKLRPSLPAAWRAVEFPLRIRSNGYRIRVEQRRVVIRPEAANREELTFVISGGGSGEPRKFFVKPGLEVSADY
ncbi:glycosyl hydrolase family 65 protein [Paenibacillus sp. CN-4]|uniref:glycosyl hydrolase family 65 protein n=1 Tax=Paenibacillus nanchangensis TaxID=3348343 RepID=UPI003978E7E4